MPNLHDSLLPCYRWGYPVNLTLITMDNDTVSTHHLANEEIALLKSLCKSMSITVRIIARILLTRLGVGIFQQFEEFLGPEPINFENLKKLACPCNGKHNWRVPLPF